MNLDDWTVTFQRNTLMGTWTWTAENVDGVTLAGLWVFSKRGNAERDALRRIDLFNMRETITGEELRARVHIQSTKPADPAPPLA